MSVSPIHAWFGLTYSSYFVMPRSALQALPVEWQRKFVLLMNEAEATGLVTPDDYEVTRRGSDGRFINDPWLDYRHPQIDHLLPDNLVRR